MNLGNHLPADTVVLYVELYDDLIKQVSGKPDNDCRTSVWMEVGQQSHRNVFFPIKNFLEHELRKKDRHIPANYR